MSFLQNSTTFAPYLNMKPHRTYILYISICLWLLVSPLCIGNLWGKDFVVVIDAGHGGHDPGAIGKISKEKNINLNVALKLGNLIKRNCDDVKVVYTRSRDVFIPLDRRAEIANNAKADLFISVHTNALANNRKRCFYMDIGSGQIGCKSGSSQTGELGDPLRKRLSNQICRLQSEFGRILHYLRVYAG